MILLTNFSFSQDQLYRSTRHKFRIKFPASWTVKDGDGPNVIKKAVKDGNSIIVLVREIINAANIDKIKNEYPKYKNSSNKIIRKILEDEMDFRRYSNNEILDMAQDLVTGLKAKFSNVTLLNKEIRFLDNEKFLCVKYSASYKVQKSEYNLINIEFSTIHKGKYYQISGGSGSEEFDTMEPVLINSINTFVFEDYN